MQQATLCFLIKENAGEEELLLAMKKRGNCKSTRLKK